MVEIIDRSQRAIEKKAANLGLQSKKPGGAMYQNRKRGGHGLTGAAHPNWRKIGEVWTVGGNKYTKNEAGEIVLYRRHLMQSAGYNIAGKKVTHIDGNPYNCAPDNLEVITHGEMVRRNSVNCKRQKDRYRRASQTQRGISIVDLILQGETFT